eukprot:9234429-Pyramimonas_sp.AAC.1
MNSCPKGCNLELKSKAFLAVDSGACRPRRPTLSTTPSRMLTFKVSPSRRSGILVVQLQS